METMSSTADKRRPPSTNKSDTAPSEDREARIACRAYELWQARGCPSGDELSDWLQAEREVGAENPGAGG